MCPTLQSKTQTLNPVFEMSNVSCTKIFTTVRCKREKEICEKLCTLVSGVSRASFLKKNNKNP